MNKFNHFVGIDISKKTFDASLLIAADTSTMIHQVFSQDIPGYRCFQNWLDSHHVSSPELLICMEHTGLYTYSLIEQLTASGLNIWVEMPLRIKKSMGLQRGGDDKAASLQIALYCYRYQDQVSLWKPEQSIVSDLRHLSAQRDRLKLSYNQLMIPLQEMESSCGQTDTLKIQMKIQAPVIRAIEKAIAAIELQVDNLIFSDPAIQATINRITSIKGVGKQTAIHMFIYTKGFSTFCSGKQLASYCGVVPFTKCSGTSVRYKTQVSPFAKNISKSYYIYVLWQPSSIMMN